MMGVGCVGRPLMANPSRSSPARSVAVFASSRSTSLGFSSSIPKAASAPATAGGGGAVENMSVRAVPAR